MNIGYSYHMCIDIRGMLEMPRGKFKKSHTRTVKDANARYMTPDECRDYYYRELGKGHVVVPMGECDNFDYQTGCKGHPTATAEVTP